MRSIGEPIPRSRAASDFESARGFVEEIGYPAIVRAAYTLGGAGSGVAHSPEDLERIVGFGLAYSRIKQVLVEESVLGWKEFEYEVMRDAADNCITICNMENLDPMGIHTGESIVVAPAQTLSDADHQTLRSAALRIIRALGVEGGCNIQFAVHPRTGEYRVIEVNPRVSRSSALASKATGYPIARIAAKIAIGLRLDEIPNPVTGKTLASFEPTLDYVVTKIPRWPFDKFPTVDRRIGTSMKSTGEVMAIGRTFEESLLKAVRSLEIDRVGLDSGPATDDQILQELREPTSERIFSIAEALRRRIRGADAILQFDVRGDGRDAAPERTQGPDCRQWTRPDRPRRRVRLLLRPRHPRVAGGGRRRDHCEQQPGDGLHRLRHLHAPVLRTAPPRGRSEHHRRGGPGRGHPSVWRPDVDQPRAASRTGVAPTSFSDTDPWHTACLHRPRGGPAKVRGLNAPPRDSSARRRLGLQFRRGAGACRAYRLSRARPAVVCAGRPRHGDRLRRGRPRAVHGNSRARLQGPPGPRRPILGPRHRNRRGRCGRRPRHLHRRHPRTHRGGGHPLG